MTVRSIVFYFFFFLITFVFLAKPVSKTITGDERSQIEEIESKLSREKEKLETFDYHEKGLLEQLSQLEQEVNEKKRALNDLKKKVGQEKTSIKKLEQRLPPLQKALADAEALGARRLVALYKYARTGYVKILADSSDLDDFWRRLKYLKAIMKADRELLERLAEEEQAYREKLARIKDQIVKKEKLRDEEVKRLDSLSNELEEKVIRLMQVHKEKEYYETAVKELELAAKDLRKTLSNIEKKDSSGMKLFSSFEDSRGQLPFPLQGDIVRAGNGTGATGPASRRGIFIKSHLDDRVQAVFPGRVEFSGRLKGYGEVIIINHGSRFFTISARFSQREKREGDAVNAGEIIGLVGRSGSPNRGILYFEIRRGGKSLDPLKWLRSR